jgi:uncharacterized membrane protein (UPF0127 family)
MNPSNRRYAALFLLLLTLGSCSREGVPETASTSPAGDLPEGTLVISGDDRLELEVDLALNSATQAKGLMNVEEIPDDYGMVFLWSDTSVHSFYMKNTLIPLDIAWWDAEGKIVDIQTMEPCTADPCRTYTPAAPHVAAVEVNAGLLEEAGVEVGDRVKLER